MDESAKEGAGDRASREPEAAKASANETAPAPPSAEVQPEQQAASNDDDGKLPIVWSPKLDAGEGGTAGAAPPEADDEPWSFERAFQREAMKGQGATGASAPSSRRLRFALLAAAVAVAAALGSFAGTHWAFGVGHSAAAKPDTADAGSLQALKAEIAELSALKASFEAATRNANAQFGRLADRLDRVEHAQTEPAAKLAHIADVIDRLEKRVAALPASPEATGSIAASPPPVQAAAASEAKAPEKVLHDWVVQSVQGGRALVENRYGGLFDVAMGSVLPGLGRVDAIKRQDGEWIVVTSRGLITSTGQ